ncbi:uncharacterized protein C19orf44 [Anabrus simplex]|uniref:uncharacterized protein C19orf44 n=1 Tax=Anabrus simplex TaxID=316456 RepID=UPI0035A2FBCD
MTRSSSSLNSDTQHPNLMKVKISHTNKLPQNKLQDPMLYPVRLVGTGTIKYTTGGYTGLTKNSSGASALDKLMKFEKKYSKPEVQSENERNFPIKENKLIEVSSDLKHSSSLKSTFQNHRNVNQITSDKIISYNHLNISGTRKYPNVTLDLNKVRNTEKDSVPKQFELSNDLEILENIQSLSQLDELISSNSAYSDNEYISDLSNSNDDEKDSKVSLIIKGDLKTKYGIGASRYNKFRSALPYKETHKLSPRAVEDPSDISFKNSFVNPGTIPNSESTFDSNQSHGILLTHERQIISKSSEERLDVNTSVSPPADTMVIMSKSGLAEDIISYESKAEELKVITSIENEHYSPQSTEKELSIEQYLQTKIHFHNASASVVEPVSPKNQIDESNNEEEVKIGIIRGNIYKNASTTNLNSEPDDTEDTILSQDISRTLDESDEFYPNIPIKLHMVENLHNEDEEIEAVTNESPIKPEQKFHSSEEHALENRSEDHISEEIFENLTSKEHSINYNTDISDEEIVESKRSSASNFSVTENTRSSVNFRSDIKHTSPLLVINKSSKTSVRENKIIGINTCSCVKSSVCNTAIQTDFIQPTFTSKLAHIQNVQHTDFPEYLKFGKSVEKFSPYPIIQYSVEPEEIEAMVSQKPVETALNEMLRHQIDLTRHFMSAQYAMYEAYMESVKMLSASYKPVTVEDTKRFIEEHRRKKASC